MCSSPEWAGLPGFDLMGLEGRERDLLGARDADRLGRRFRQVDHPTMGIRAPVVDPHHHRLARLLVRDPDLGAERQSLVGGGQIVGVEGLPPIIFPGRPERWWGDEALKAETDAPQATLEQRHQAAGDVLALRCRGFFSAGALFSRASHIPVETAQ
jgi:hypothetical protein